MPVTDRTLRKDSALPSVGPETMGIDGSAVVEAIVDERPPVTA